MSSTEREFLDYFDEWEYFYDHDSAVGIVVNHFRDEGAPMLHVYVVPKDKVAKNDWHNDMIDITDSRSDEWKSQPMSRDELIRENLNLQMRIDYAKQELDKLKAFNPMTLENLLDWREHE